MILQQLNRQSGSMDRRKANMQLPEIQDLKGTGGVAEASDVVIAIFNPARQKVADWEGYNIDTLRDKFRALVILKNRYGEPDVAIPVNFFGKVNIFMEIPSSDVVSRDYPKYLDIVKRYEDLNSTDIEEDDFNEDIEVKDQTWSGFTIDSSILNTENVEKVEIKQILL